LEIFPNWTRLAACPILAKFPNITCTINPNCTRHRMITYTNLYLINKYFYCGCNFPLGWMKNNKICLINVKEKFITLKP
jgi:hypothetical protein